MLARLQCFDNQVGMRIMTGENGNGIYVRVGDNLVIVGGRILEAEFFTGMLRRARLLLNRRT